MLQGTIKAIVRAKGFGFITNGTGLEYYFHKSVAPDWLWLQEGARVVFDPAPRDESPRGPRAKSVQLAGP